MQRWTAERGEARRLRIAGYELADVQDAAQRAAKGELPASAAEIERRWAEREQHDRDEIWGWHANDLDADERFRNLLDMVERGHDAAIRAAADPARFDRLARGEDIELSEPDKPEHDSPLQRARRRLGLAKIRSRVSA